MTRDAPTGILLDGGDGAWPREVRRALAAALTALGVGADLPPAGDVAWLADALAAQGITVDRPPSPSGPLRVTCPEDAVALEHLVAAVGVALAPEALLLDLDGVLADVSGSYRDAIIGAAASYGVAITPADVSRAKAEGGANNDWVLTRRLLARRGVRAPLAEVTARFEALYQGTADVPGLWRTETPLLPAAVLARWAARLPLAIVTGRPRGDADRFLEHAGIAGHISALVCMGDAPAKPDPAPVRLAMERLGVTRAWLVGDTPDDIRAARAAGALPLAVEAPGDAGARPALLVAGAARVLVDPADVEELLP